MVRCVSHILGNYWNKGLVSGFALNVNSYSCPFALVYSIFAFTSRSQCSCHLFEGNRGCRVVKSSFL